MVDTYKLTQNLVRPYPLTAQVAHQLLDLGLDVIPIHSSRKEPLYTQWQTREPEDQINQALDKHQDFNIGVRGGGGAGLVVIDCEDEQTRQRVEGWLDINDINPYLIIHSASGSGCHIWLTCHNRPPDYDSYSNLHPFFGSGEVRYGPRSQSLAPPSIAYSKRSKQTGSYSFEQELDEALLVFEEEFVPVDWNDVITPLFDGLAGNTADESQPPVPPTSGINPAWLPHQPAPRLVYELVKAQQGVPANVPIPHPRGTREDYDSRSEVEQAIICILILCGWPLSAIKNFFNSHQLGHYNSHYKQSYYLSLSYQRACQHLFDEDPIRREIADYYHRIASMPWPGSSYLTRDVYLYIILIAWREASWEPIVPHHDLQQHLDASQGGITDALNRLEEQYQAIQREKVEHRGYNKIIISRDAQFPSTQSQWGYIQLGCYSPFWTIQVDQELPRSVSLVYAALSEQPCSIREISLATGVSRNTVSACLHGLEDHALAVQISRYSWVVGDSPMESEGGFRSLQEAAEQAIEADEGCSLELFVEQPREPVNSSWEADPVEVYIRVMAKVYGRRIWRERLSEANCQCLEELAELLAILHEDDQLRSDSVYDYILWAARAFLERQPEWPLLWINVLCAPSVVSWYSNLTRPSRDARRWCGDEHLMLGEDESPEMPDKPSVSCKTTNSHSQAGNLADIRDSADEVVCVHDDGWCTRRASTGQHYLDPLE